MAWLRSSTVVKVIAGKAAQSLGVNNIFRAIPLHQDLMAEALGVLDPSGAVDSFLFGLCGVSEEIGPRFDSAPYFPHSASISGPLPPSHSCRLLWNLWTGKNNLVRLSSCITHYLLVCVCL